MHEWAAVNTWPRPMTNGPRPMTNGLNGRYSRYSVNIPVKTEINGRYSINIPISATRTPNSGLSRCRTTFFGPTNMIDKHQVYKPRLKLRESSTLNYIQYLKVSNKETEAKLHSNTVHMLHVQQPKSEIEARDTPRSSGSMAVPEGGLMKERTQVYLTSSTDVLRREESSTWTNKQEMKISTAVVPRKGLIALSALETDFPHNHAADQRRQILRDHEPGKSRPKALIRRKDIMDHFKAGFKALEDEETQRQQDEELQKSIENYTFTDLKNKIIEMTDVKSLHRTSPQLENPASAPTPRRVPPPQPFTQKTVTLPAIKNIDPFKAKSLR